MMDALGSLEAGAVSEVDLLSASLAAGAAAGGVSGAEMIFQKAAAETIPRPTTIRVLQLVTMSYHIDCVKKVDIAEGWVAW